MMLDALYVCAFGLWTVALTAENRFFDGPYEGSGCCGGSTGRCRCLHGRGHRSVNKAEVSAAAAGFIHVAAEDFG